MIGAGAIIAECFGAVCADEDGAGVAHLVEQGVGVGDHQFQMLGRDAIGNRHRAG